MFIVPKKPWMDGRIEDFNGDFERFFWSKGTFNTLEHIRRESKIFHKRHNESQNWKNRKKNLEEVPVCRIPKDFEIDVKNLSLTEGKVHLIREVKKGGKISVLNEDFDVSESLLYEYVWATLNTREEKLMVIYR